MITKYIYTGRYINIKCLVNQSELIPVAITNKRGA
jgi:hypothetical protein